MPIYAFICPFSCLDWHLIVSILLNYFIKRWNCYINIMLMANGRSNIFLSDLDLAPPRGGARGNLPPPPTHVRYWSQSKIVFLQNDVGVTSMHKVPTCTRICSCACSMPTNDVTGGHSSIQITMPSCSGAARIQWWGGEGTLPYVYDIWHILSTLE